MRKPDSLSPAITFYNSDGNPEVGTETLSGEPGVKIVSTKFPVSVRDGGITALGGFPFFITKTP
jgi:hypothetical protein